MLTVQDFEYRLAERIEEIKKEMHAQVIYEECFPFIEARAVEIVPIEAERYEAEIKKLYGVIQELEQVIEFLRLPIDSRKRPDGYSIVNKNSD